MKDLKISLDNFDPHNRESPYLNSPTSLEACRMQGLEPEELLLLSPIEHKTIFCKGVSEEAARQHYTVYIKKREEAFKKVREARERLLRNDVSPMKNKKETTRLGPFDSLEREQKELERLERKQQIELKKLVERELSKDEIEVKRAKIEAKAREREIARLVSAAAKQKELEEKRIQDEEKRRIRALLEEEQKRNRAEIEAEKERRRLEQENERLKARQKEASAKEDSRNQKRLAKEYIAAKTLEEQKLYARQRAAQLAERERKRKEMLDEQARQRAEESRILSEKFNAKLSTVRTVIDQQLQLKQAQLNEKQQMIEEKRRVFELKRLQQRERSRLRSERKEEEIRRIKATNELLEERRRQEFSIQMSKAEIRKIEQLAQIEAEMKEKQLKSFEKQCRIEMIQSSIGQGLSLRTEQILEKQAKKEEMVESVQRKLSFERHRKWELARLKEQDSQLAKQRKAKMEEYRQRVMLEKLKEEDTRIERIKEEKKRLQGQKLALRQQVEAKKLQIVENFSKLKLGPSRIDKEALFSHLDDIVSLNSTNVRPRSLSRPNEYHEARLEIERLKQAQAEELLQLIQQEQIKETLREQELTKTHTDKLEEIETLFGLKRAEASNKIEALAARHREQLDREAKRYGLQEQ